MRVVTAERLKAKLSVHEDDGVAGLEEVFGGCRTASTWPDGQSFRDTWKPSTLGASNSPALKLSRKRTLDVASGFEERGGEGRGVEL